jgi:Fe-S-cluster containining protein
VSTPAPDHSAQAFYRELRTAFNQTWQDAPDAARSQALLQQAWNSFEGNVALQSEGQPPVACHKGCASCCELRVSALTPEVLMIAAFLRATAPALAKHGIDLIQTLRETDAATRGLDDAARMALRRRCPFLVQGVCLIHKIRPLACRGHASHDKRACIDAVAGRVEEVPFSGPHRVVRLLVQSALQASLRMQDLAWGSYELNHALVLALDNDQAGAQWLSGADPLAAAIDKAEQRQAMAAWFDAEA